MKNTSLPTPFTDVMITYKKEISSGAYGSIKTKVVVTKRGFYTDLFEHFSIPNDWQKFKGILLPHGFGGDKKKPNEIIKWEEIKD